MSAYKYFFIKSNNNEFIQIGEFSRNTEVYRYCNAPYEKIKPLTIDNLNQIICDIEQGIECVKRGIQADKDERELVVKMNNSINEKMETLLEIGRSIEENTNYLDDLKWACNYFAFLINIIDYAKFNNNYDIDNYIYVGEEIPEPTVNDIVESKKIKNIIDEQ